MKGFAVEIFKNNVTLRVSVKKDLSKKYLQNSLYGCVTIHDGLLTSEEVSWDNIEYFTDGLSKEQKQDCKKDLVEKNQYYKEWYKDLKWCFKRAIEMNIV